MSEFKEILAFFSVPGIFASIIMILIKVSPVSHLTADSVETSMFSKEKKLLINVVKYLFQTLYFLFILFSLSIFMSEMKLINWLAEDGMWLLVLLAITTELLYFYFYLLADFSPKGIAKDDGKLLQISRKVENLLSFAKMNKFLYLIYCIFLFLTFSILISVILYGIKEETFKIYLLYFGLSYIIVLPVPKLIKIGWKVFDINFSNEFPVYIKELPRNGETCNWYIFHRVNKTHVLIGDHKDPVLCSKKKIIAKEEIINREIFIDRTKENTFV